MAEVIDIKYAEIQQRGLLYYSENILWNSEKVGFICYAENPRSHSLFIHTAGSDQSEFLSENGVLGSPAVFILPEFRGRGLFSWAFSEFIREKMNQGVRAFTIVDVRPRNIEVFTSGFKKNGLCVYVNTSDVDGVPFEAGAVLIAISLSPES